MAKRPLTIPARSEITDDTPLRLEVAAALAYPGEGMTASGLRKEHDAGRLVTEMTAGKEFTTLAAINRMRELCRGRSKGPLLFGAVKTATNKTGDHERSNAALTKTINDIIERENEKRRVERDDRRRIRDGARTPGAGVVAKPAQPEF